MIQKVAINRFGTHSSAAPSARHAVPDDPTAWTQGSGTKKYSLEVVQHPIRARMCGFGDKDRRPLAPAAVAKMIVRNPDNSIVDVDDIDYTFFVVTVDLWSSDAKQEMNLVLHPSSSDRYQNSSSNNSANTSPNGPKSRRRNATSGSAAAPRSEEQSPVSGHSPLTPSAYPPRHLNEQPTQSNGSTSYAPSTSNQGYNPANGQLTYPPPQPAQAPPSYQHENPYAPDPWSYANQSHPPHPPMERTSSQSQYTPSLPPIHSFNRGPTTASTSANGEPWQPDHRHESNGAAPPPSNSFRQWPTATDPGNFASDHALHPPSTTSSSAIDPALRTNGSSALPPPPTSDVRETSSWGHPPPPPDPYPPSQAYASPTTHSAPPNYDPNAPPVMYASASAAYAQHVQSSSTHAQYHQASYPTNPAPAPPPTVPLPRHTYTRTLVGPLAANACRLVDEHRKPGIFFLFQDLSIRTEGTFRLRLRLMNIGAPPAPDPGSTRVHNSHSPILAQTFTEPFTVYSAKRFPGVPDTTPLSIAFGNQGQKLPLRNRHGPSKGGRKRRRGGESEGSDDDSDG